MVYIALWVGAASLALLALSARRAEAALQWDVLTSSLGHLPVAGPVEQTSCLILDVDGDGVDEIIIGCRKAAPALTMIRKARNGYMRYVIEPESIPIEAGGAFCDIDGDGDLDIVFGEDWTGNRLFWWENPSPNFDPNVPWKRHVIKGDGANQHHDQLFGDFDGDGKPELVFWNQREKALFMARIPADPRAEDWERVAIYRGEGEGLAKGDIDGDGKDELLAAGKWFRHLGGDDFEPCVIDESQTIPRIAVADLNGDGRLEVVMGPSDVVGRLRWYSFQGDPRRTSSWVAHELLDDDVYHTHSLAIADFDGDGALDIFAGEMRELQPGANQNPDATMWVFLGDGTGNFTPTELARERGVHEGKVGDFDGDGKPDIAAKPYCWNTPRLDLWLNRTPRR
ncbi:VCBS repeat-containing protein [Candidatus Poribacteria bacterium]|nr:VCBS repeat-containing protein [Candidatus Poribacteria bacterium]